MSKLIGKQAKLDRNKNGKLDSEDFKMLRAGKKKAVKEQFIDRVIGALLEMRLNEAKIKPSFARQELSNFSDRNLGAKALSKAGEARKSGNKPEARKQLGRAKIFHKGAKSEQPLP